MGNFRFPEGVQFLGDDGHGRARFSVSIPIDADGFFGRECPECQQHFRIAHEDYDALPEDVRFWCVYCGHHDDHSEFMTKQQNGRLIRAAEDYTHQLVGQMLDKSFRGLAGRTRNSVIKISYRSRPFYPAPLPDIDEERLVRERTCAGCSLRYAVFGEHRFCPVCGELPPLVAALDALDAETSRLDALADLPEATTSILRENGVLDRTYVDTVENVVAVVEAFAGRVFRAKVPDADVVLKGRGKVFQRLDHLDDLFAQHLDAQIREALGSEWDELLRTWAARHAFTHCDGIIDAKYLSVDRRTSQRVGQRLRITEGDARAAVSRAQKLCRVMAR